MSIEHASWAGQEAGGSQARLEIPGTSRCASFVMLLVVGTLLGACSGDSDGGPLPVDFAALSRDDAAEVAGIVLGPALEGGSLGEYTERLALSGSITPFQQSFASTKATGLRIADTVLKQGRTGLVNPPIAPTTSPCGVAGSVTLSGDISSTQTLTAGDTISFEFTDCDDGISVVSGLFVMTISSFAGDFVGGSFEFTADVALGNFSVAENGATHGPMDGDVSIDLDFTSMPSLGLTVDADSFAVSDGTMIQTFESYSLTRSSDSTTGAYTLDVSGRFSNDELDGVLDFATIELLQSPDGGNPSTGRIEVSGRGATMTIIVLDSSLLRLEVDENGNGTVDAVIDTTWDGLI